MDWGTIIGYLLTPLTGLFGWLAGRKKSKNDFLQEMQASIDMLVAKNKDLIEEVTLLRAENSKLISNQETLKGQIETLTNQNNKFQREIEILNEQLKNVKTITRKA